MDNQQQIDHAFLTTEMQAELDRRFKKAIEDAQVDIMFSEVAMARASAKRDWLFDNGHM